MKQKFVSDFLSLSADLMNKFSPSVFLSLTLCLSLSHTQSYRVDTLHDILLAESTTHQQIDGS